MKQRAKKIPLPHTARALCSLPRIDYEDCFIVETDRVCDLSAEEWARRILEGAPANFRISAPGAWFALGLKHGLPWSSETILGWRVVRSGPDFTLLGAESRTGMPAELLVKRERGAVLFATLIQHESPFMRRVWRLVERPHQRIVPRLLARGVNGLEDSPTLTG